MSDKERIHIFIFIHDLAPFGAQVVALNTVKYLDRKKFTVTVCSFGADHSLADKFRDSGAEVIQLRARRYLDPGAWLRLFSVILKLRPNIIQTNMAELSLPVRLLALLLPGTLVIHTVQNPFSSEPWYWRFLNIRTLFLCARVVFCSESMRASAGYTGENSLVVQNGMAIEPLSPDHGLRAELGVGREVKLVCCVARLARQKGQDILIEALALLSSRGRDLKVLLAGDGEDLVKLKALALKLGVSGKVFFLGRRSDIASILSASDIYAAPSRWEGFGLSLGEAMLAGLPCIGSEIAGHADFLKDGVSGLAVPPEDPAALAAGIARLLDNPQEASKLAVSGHDLITQFFSVEDMARKYERVYLDMAAGPRK